MPNFASLPGFRDFFPEEMAVRSYVMSVWHDVAARYGFHEYDGPPLEQTDLYIEKSGPEIVQQLYNFADKGEREIALRPEMTPTLARMVGARAGSMKKPIKWYATPQLFRYERAQRGRLREHFQLNFDIIGDESVGADAELLAASIDVLRAFGLTEKDVVARISDRKLLRGLLLHAQVPEERLTLVYNIVDKLEREPREVIAKRLADEAGLGPSVIDETLSIFEHRDFDAVRDAFGGTEGIGDEIARMRELLSTLEAMGLGGFVKFDLSVVRGLAYYTGMVFELFDAQGEFRAIAGGGRYDNLLGVVSGNDMPALGFGMGDVVLTELLKSRNLLPDTKATIDYFVAAVGEEQRSDVLSIVHALRERGHSVDYALRATGLGKQFKAASSLGAKKVVVIGPDEISEGVAIVRDMESGEETRVPLAELAGPS